MITQTSLLAYRSLSSTKINQRQSEVLEALEEIFPACNRQISDHSKLPINVVTPRMGELRRKRLVTIAYIGVDSRTGRKATFWRPANADLSE